ncbi:hypothetical protein ID866_5447 [Astraeus odoratus]|nr:hypothetical protein ID866_5447 [Astraeus odoratus]
MMPASWLSAALRRSWPQRFVTRWRHLWNGAVWAA